MKTIGFLLIVILANGISQRAGVVPSADISEHNLCVDLTTSPPSEEDTAAFRRILDVLSIDPGSISLYLSHDPKMKNYGGAISFACEIPNHEIYETYERRIVYDSDLIQGDAARDFVFAHEIAHHMEFQTLSGARSKKEELRADYDGAKYLIRLGWNKARLLHALDLLNLSQGAQPGYPTLAERKAVVEEAAELPMPLPPTGLEGRPVFIATPSYTELLDELLNLRYQGPIRFLRVGTDDKFVCAVGTPDPKIPSTHHFAFLDNCERAARTSFDLQISPKGNLGYWIMQDEDPCPEYAANCRYVLESVGDQLRFWNQDLAADQDGWEKELGEQELFSFEAADPSKGLVRIKAHKEGYIFVDPKTAKLQNGGNREQAAEFRVLFEPK